MLWLVLGHWRDLVLDGRDRTLPEKLAMAQNGGRLVTDEEQAERDAAEAARVALLSVDHFAALRQQLGLAGLNEDPALDDVEAYPRPRRRRLGRSGPSEYPRGTPRRGRDPPSETRRRGTTRNLGTARRSRRPR